MTTNTLYQVVIKTGKTFQIDGPATRYTDAKARLSFWRDPAFHGTPRTASTSKLLRLDAANWSDDLTAQLNALNA